MSPSDVKLHSVYVSISCSSSSSFFSFYSISFCILFLFHLSLLLSLSFYSLQSQNLPPPPPAPLPHLLLFYSLPPGPSPRRFIILSRRSSGAASAATFHPARVVPPGNDGDLLSAVKLIGSEIDSAGGEEGMIEEDDHWLQLCVCIFILILTRGGRGANV